MSTRSRRFLLTLWDGGGNAGPNIDVARRLVARGHTVHALGDETLRRAAGAAGCGFSRWLSAPNRKTLDVGDDYVRDWEAADAIDMLRRLRDRVMAGPAAAFAADTAAAIGEVQPDAVLADAVLYGSMMAGQAADLPVAVLNPNVWVLPTPATADKGVLKLMLRVFNTGLPDLNAAREQCGLPPLTGFFDQVLGADRILVLSSETFDRASAFVPDNVRYVGPALEDPPWAAPWTPPWPGANRDPLVLVGFSTTFQDQGALVQRVIDALTHLQVRGVVTLGPMLSPSDFVGNDAIAVERSVPHSVILKEASVAVSHCGHGTTMKSLMAGVPMVCIPMGRDQDVTADRVVELGAGVRLSTAVSSHEIQAAIADVLSNDTYRQSARRLAQTLATEHGPLDAMLELEDLVGLMPTGS